MSFFARLMYGALVWKERQRARRLRAAGAGQPAAEHLETGERGEMLAYWYLRRCGYTIVARNRRARSGRGEIDLIAWDGPVLAFIEVKSRTSLEGGPPETAVSPAKRKRIVHAARDYLKRLRRKEVNYRYDVVSVLWDPEAGLTARLTKDAFKE